MKLNDLTTAQRLLVSRLEAEYDGQDLQIVLRAENAPAEDKAAAADFWGGPGAGAEFRAAK